MERLEGLFSLKIALCRLVGAVTTPHDHMQCRHGLAAEACLLRRLKHPHIVRQGREVW